MNSSEHERLTDELIGEAVLSLLKEKGAINTLALIAKLQSMQSHEQDGQRRAMIMRLVEEISSNTFASAPHQNKHEQHEMLRDAGDNVYPLFGNRQRQDRSKKL
jgi:probable RcsB/C two-component-system connector